MTMVAEKLHKHIITTDMAKYWWDDDLKTNRVQKETHTNFTKQPLTMSTQQRCQVSSLWPSEEKTKTNTWTFII